MIVHTGHPCSQHNRVYLDGVQLTNCIAADDKAGWVILGESPSRVQVKFGDREPIMANPPFQGDGHLHLRLTGEVRIENDDPNWTPEMQAHWESELLSKMLENSPIWNFV